MAETPIRLGVAGLGRAFMLMLPTLARDPRIRMVAAADPRPEARARFEADFDARSYETVEALCADPELDAVYVATPHQYHVAHVRAATAMGKHVLVEKPMALAVEDCLAMVAAARQASVHLIVGHSHSFDAPYLRAREMIRSGRFGAVRMITALNFTDYLYRPRRPEELDTEQGGGAVFSQAPHQVEVVRLLAGRPARAIRASTSVWDPARGTEGAYNALLDFGKGLSATLTYNGHGHFDTDEFQEWTGEMGTQRDAVAYGGARAALRGIASPADEAALKEKRAYGVGSGAAEARAAPSPPAYNHFGLVIASCEKADLRPTARGVLVYGDDERWFEPLPPPDIPRSEVIDELHAAVVHGLPPLHNGEWGLATAEICLALLRSSRSGQDVMLKHQGPTQTASR
ncbi:Gfo/Idh/MocA family oxidoreductase (plasmid) [Roseomonas sp. OT10]|uniref:Gfo/Idh/MocA family oxidoreductase n=1 Tax=Roseomonas cutis TaxID=2897332 RepID=UPI001E4D7C98|nr:Gfo/Idh/MocA family oxidoreductase [Roseomonas sp. OT10]UFN51762.1 Gfo/Idh/MocA family oxidoreductase [Roseomonas sp. OT10]